jgi:hypothetical protein
VGAITDKEARDAERAGQGFRRCTASVARNSSLAKV